MSKNIICYGVILREHFGFAQHKLRDRRILETLRGACPELHEILHFVQNDRKRRAQGDMRIGEHSYA